MTAWPSGLRRWLQAPVRKGVGSNPTAVSDLLEFTYFDFKQLSLCFLFSKVAVSACKLLSQGIVLS